LSLIFSSSADDAAGDGLADLRELSDCLRISREKLSGKIPRCRSRRGYAKYRQQFGVVRSDEDAADIDL